MSPQPRCLLLSPFFYPEPISTGRYNTHLSEFLRDSGYDVTVACSHPLYPTWKPEHSDQTLPGIRIVRGGLNVHYPAQVFARRAVLELWFAWYATRQLWALRRQVDVVVGVFPPSLFAAVGLMVCKLPWVGIVHDLQGAYAEPTGGWIGGVVARLVHRVERYAFSRCKSLVFLSQTMKQRAATEYQLQDARCEVLYPRHNVQLSDTPDPGVAALFDPAHKHVVYAGALGQKQNPEGLLALFEGLLKRRDDVVCHIFSAGPVWQSMRERTDLDPRLRLHDLVDEAALQTLLERSTLHCIIEIPGASQGSLPSKLANLLWLAVPIFCICDAGSELAGLVERSGVGRVDSTFDTATQVQALDEFVGVAAALHRTYEQTRLRPALEELFTLRRLVPMLDSARAEVS
jgi:glycosyltransferase involved in cell wall biosynthesis